jgi:ribose transport system ATP-binding protein
MIEQSVSKGGMPPLLELSNVSKSFGGIAALKDVDFTLVAGEIHGLVGENGAGKSTTMKIIAGVYHDFEGEMRVDGKPVHFRSARDALAAGIGMVHQELSTIPDLTVAENVFLGHQPLTKWGTIDWERINKEAAQLVSSLGLDIDPKTRMGSLPVGLQQLVELSRVLFSGARIIILDEPTSALSPPEVKRLFEVLRKIKAEGRGIIFISHFLDDVLEISDKVTVFRNGKKVATETAASLTKESSILNGDDSKTVVLATNAIGDDKLLRDVSIQLRAGEITGVYGFMGCGQIELARALFGKIKLKHGNLQLNGVARAFSSTADARGQGVAFVPENRRMMLFRTEPVYKNISISILDRIHRLFVKPKSERLIAEKHVIDLQIRPPNPSIMLGSLSGGNQQKVALAKWLTHLPKVLILSEPTRGMDVGAKEDVIRIVKSLRDRGVAILVLSTEPETILTLADRVSVLRKGRVEKEFNSGTIHKADLLASA